MTDRVQLLLEQIRGDIKWQLSRQLEYKFKLMTLVRLLSFLFCLKQLVPQSTEHFDPFQAMLNQAASKVRLVKKLANIDFAIKIQNQNVWDQFPDMNIYWRQDNDQFVYFKYQITFEGSGSCIFLTRMMIDNKENPQFRAIYGPFVYHTIKNSDKVWLPKGYHNARVQFRGDCVVNIYKNGGDWQANYFKVEYYKFKPTQ